MENPCEGGTIQDMSANSGRTSVSLKLPVMDTIDTLLSLWGSVVMREVEG
jgi:hypothetical protein